MHTLKIGLASCVQPSFWGSSKDLYRTRYLPQMEALAKELDFQLLSWQEDIVTEVDGEAACRYFNDQGVDFVLLQATTFPGGGVILPFEGLRARLGLWAIPECIQGGAIPLNSFCGVNMLGSILGQYIDAKRPVKWFYGEVESPLFRERFAVTLGALRGIAAMQGAKVGLVGGIAPGFNDFAFDERKTWAKLGIRVDRLPEYGDIRDKALAYDEAAVKKAMAEFAQDAACVGQCAQKGVENAARIYLAYVDLMRENGYDAVAVGCWPKYRRDFNIVACGIIGRLLEKGYLAACEGDVDSMAAMLMLRGIAKGSAPMLMDLSDLDFADNTAMLWHCGSAPAQFADARGFKLETHYKPGKSVPGADDIKVGVVNDMTFKPGAVTIARFTWEYSRLLLLDATMVEKDSDPGFDGSRGWIGNIHMAGQPVDAKTLANTLLVSRFQHHYPVVMGHYANEVMECLAWLGIQAIEPIPYRPYLQNFTEV